MKTWFIDQMSEVRRVSFNISAKMQKNCISASKIEYLMI